MPGGAYRLFLNAAEPGNDNTVTVNNAVVRLYRSNYGFLFGLSAGDQVLFNTARAANPSAMIGVGASFTNVSGGNESFAVGTIGGDGGGSTSVVPEPSTYLLMASGLVAIGLMQRKRRTS